MLSKKSNKFKEENSRPGMSRKHQENNLNRPRKKFIKSNTNDYFKPL